MKLAIRVYKDDDERFGHKKGDVMVVDLDYDWDDDKCVCTIRKRAYHRALKRNEFWAVYIKMCRDATLEMMNEMLKPSPFLKMPHND